MNIYIYKHLCNHHLYRYGLFVVPRRLPSAPSQCPKITTSLNPPHLIGFPSSHEWVHTVGTLLSFTNILSLRIIHIIAFINSLFFVLLSSVPLYVYYPNLFIHSTVDRYLGCLWTFGTFVNNNDVNIFLQVFGKHSQSFIPDKYPEVEPLSLKIDMFTFSRCCQTIFQSACTNLHLYRSI